MKKPTKAALAATKQRQQYDAAMKPKAPAQEMIPTLREMFERLQGALLQSAQWFDDYADNHLAKDPPDAEKAKTNRDGAEYCRRQSGAQAAPPCSGS